MMMILYTTVIVIFSKPGRDFSVDVSSNYSDTCHYEDGQMQYPCGDICLGAWYEICTCGDESYSALTSVAKIFEGWPICCTPPSVQCRKTVFGVNCPEGEFIKANTFHFVDVEKFNVTGTIPCNGKCINDYRTSKYHGIFTHYTCPDKCV